MGARKIRRASSWVGERMGERERERADGWERVGVRPWPWMREGSGVWDGW